MDSILVKFIKGIIAIECQGAFDQYRRAIVKNEPVTLFDANRDDGMLLVGGSDVNNDDL